MLNINKENPYPWVQVGSLILIDRKLVSEIYNVKNPCSAGKLVYRRSGKYLTKKYVRLLQLFNALECDFGVITPIYHQICFSIEQELGLFQEKFVILANIGLNFNAII